MTYRAVTIGRSFSPRRAGRVAFLMLGVLALILVFGIVVINSFFVAEVRAQQENATDAAALAAAEVLAQEALLFGDPRIFDVKTSRLGGQSASEISPRSQTPAWERGALGKDDAARSIRPPMPPSLSRRRITWAASVSMFKTRRFSST